MGRMYADTVTPDGYKVAGWSNGSVILLPRLEVIYYNSTAWNTIYNERGVRPYGKKSRNCFKGHPLPDHPRGR